MSAQGLPAHILALFTPRPPPQRLPPCVDKANVKTGGCAEYVEFFSAEVPQPKEFFETPKEKKDRRHKEKMKAHKEQLAKEIEKYDPHKDPNASGDPFKTLYVSRISYDTTEKKLKREFEVFGSIKKARMIFDLKGKPRGYAFVEFEHERDLKNAYKQGDGKKMDGRRVMVDVERGRTVEGWLPRRLGGGRGPGRVGKPSKKKAAEIRAKEDRERREKAEKDKDKKDGDRRGGGGGDRDRRGGGRDDKKDDRGGGRGDRGGDRGGGRGGDRDEKKDDKKDGRGGGGGDRRGGGDRGDRDRKESDRKRRRDD